MSEEQRRHVEQTVRLLNPTHFLPPNPASWPRCQRSLPLLTVPAALSHAIPRSSPLTSARGNVSTVVVHMGAMCFLQRGGVSVMEAPLMFTLFSPSLLSSSSGGFNVIGSPDRLRRNAFSLC